jgi:protein MpaA
MASITATLLTLATSVVVGHSLQGRPIELVHVARPGAPRVLVVGAVHGDEGAGIPIVRALARAHARDDLWLVPDLNPDGHAHAKRQDARGVDLNRNFPASWRPIGRPWDVFYSGPRPFSEPETRVARDLVLRIRPQYTIWFHQHLDAVWAFGGSTRAGRVYARLAGMRLLHRRWLDGSASNWQNHLRGGGASFVVELPAGRLDAGGVRRHVAAVLRLPFAAP